MTGMFGHSLARSRLLVAMSAVPYTRALGDGVGTSEGTELAVE